MVNGRRERINQMVESVETAVLDAKKEWFYRGESAALKKFVYLLGLAITTLANLLSEVKPRLPASVAAVYDDMQARVTTLNLEWAVINTAMDSLLRVESEMEERERVANLHPKETQL